MLGANGFVVAVPSITPGGSYEFIRGDLSQIGNLPVMRGVDQFKAGNIVDEALTGTGEPKRATRQQTFSEGDRNRMLFRACMLQAKHSVNFDELLVFAREFNETNMQPNLLDIEVVRTATSAWEYD